MDLVRLVPRTILVTTDMIAEKTFGSISRIARNTNQKIHSSLGINRASTPNK